MFPCCGIDTSPENTPPGRFTPGIGYAKIMPLSEDYPMDRRDDMNNETGGKLGPGDYQGLNELEKDAEITRAIIRLQNRIHTLLFALELETEKRDPLVVNNEMTGKEESTQTAAE